MKILLIFLSLTINAHAAHICYFSLNNEKEFKVMDKFTKTLNQLSDLEEEITVAEYLTEGENPNYSFKEMVESGVKCDGLVISGHHTGSYGGKRANGSLGIGFMELLSCNPQHKQFFENIKSIWLQGCRTLGQKISSDDFLRADTSRNCLSADCHRDRVGALLEVDHLNQSFADLEFEFSDTLDQDNPLSSRYLRVFPRATVFGWTKSAPGVKSRSEYSIPYHMANLGRLNDDRKLYFDDRKRISQKDAKVFSKTMIQLLSSSEEFNPECEIPEDVAINAWLAHGRARIGLDGVRLKIDPSISFANDDLQAFPSLISSGNQDLEFVKKLDCILKKNPITKEELLETLDIILAKENLLGYTFNSLNELIKKIILHGYIDLLVAVRDKFQQSQDLESFLMQKLADKTIGSLRRIDYYGFYKNMTGKASPSVEKQILKASRKAILKNPLTYSERDYLETLIASLFKNEIIDKSFLEDLVNAKNISANSLSLIVENISKNEKFIEDRFSMIKRVMNHPNADNFTLATIARSIASYKEPFFQGELILQQIINRSKGDDYLMGEVAKAVGEANFPIQNVENLLLRILQHQNASNYSFNGVLEAIAKVNRPLQNADKMIDEIIKNKKVTMFNLSYAIFTMSHTKSNIENLEEKIQSIIDNPLYIEQQDFSDLASVLLSGKQEISRVDEWIELIINSPNISSFSLNTFPEVLFKYPYPIKNPEKIITKILDNKLSNDLALLYSIEFLSKLDDGNAITKVITKVLNHPLFGHDHVEKLLDFIEQSNNKYQQSGEWISSILKYPEIEKYSIAKAFYLIRYSDTPLYESQSNLQLIISSPKTDFYIKIKAQEMLEELLSYD